MPDLKITIKSATGSLARRAVVVSLCLLVLPLLLHSLFLYRADYEYNLKVVSSTLKLTAEAQKSLLEERLQIQWKILDAVKEPQEMQHLGIKKIALPPGAGNYFAIVGIDPDALAGMDPDTLIVGKKIDEASALMIATPLDRLFEMMTRFEEDVFPTSLSFIDEKGNALAGAKQETTLFVQLPIQGANFFLYLSVPEGAVEELNKSDYIYHFLSLLFFIGVVGGIIVWMITRRIARPLNTLCKAMERVAEGAVHVRYTPDKMGFEINELGKQFNQTLDRLLHHQQAAERERIGRERLAEELKIGHEIQVSLLPTHLPELKGIDIAEGFLPAREVGGDFYDLFPLEHGAFLIAIADTAGKGISACLYSLGLRSMLRTLAATNNNLSEIVLRANDLFWRDAHPSGIFVTLWIGIYDPRARTLDYCSQGHPPALLIHQGKAKELWTAGIAMGAQAFDAVSVKRVLLPPDALLFLYTDGIIEAHDPDNQLFGAQRLREFLLRSSKLSAESLVERLLQEIALFSRGAPQHDDMTLLAIRMLE